MNNDYILCKIFIHSYRFFSDFYICSTVFENKLQKSVTPLAVWEVLLILNCQSYLYSSKTHPICWKGAKTAKSSWGCKNPKKIVLYVLDYLKNHNKNRWQLMSESIYDMINSSSPRTSICCEATPRTSVLKKQQAICTERNK